MASIRDNPIIDLALTVSILGLLTTVTIEVIKVHERIARLEARLDQFSIVTQDEYNGDMAFIKYRLNRLEDELLKQYKGDKNEDGIAR